MPPKVKITKEMIINSAFEIVKEFGLKELSAKSVSKKLNCSTQPIFWVFETIDNLKKAVEIEVNRVYNSYMIKEIPGLPLFKSIGFNYVMFAKYEPNLFEFMFMSERTKNLNPDQIIEIDDNKEYIYQTIQESYDVTIEIARKIYLYMWIFSHGIATLIALNKNLFTDKEIGEALTDNFQGLIIRLKKEGK